MDVTQLVTVLSFSCLCLSGVYSEEVPVNKDSEAWDRDKFKEEAGQTFNLVFHKYNDRIRPPQEYIEVNVVITLRHIRHLDIRKQELQTVLDIEMDWFDSRLEWYAYKVYHIDANASTVWSPDMVYTNGVSPAKALYPSAVRIKNNGHVWWTRREMVTTLCHTKPNDIRQMCEIKLGFMSNKQGGQTDRYFSNTSMLVLPADFVNHEWRLLSAELIMANETQSITLDVELELEKMSALLDGQDMDSSMDGGNGDEASRENCSDMEEMRDGNRNGQSQVSPSLWMSLIVSMLCCVGFIRPKLCQILLSR